MTKFFEMEAKKKYEFAKPESPHAVYDAFFENSRLAEALGVLESDFRTLVSQSIVWYGIVDELIR